MRTIKTQKQKEDERDALKDYLAFHGMTISDLATKMKCSQSAICSSLSRAGITKKLGERIARALDCAVEDFMPQEREEARTITIPFFCSCGKSHYVTVTIE